MKFIFWTLFLSAAAVFVMSILVGVFTGHEYRLNRDPDNPRSSGQTDLTIGRDNAAAVMWLGVMEIIFSFGAIRNWREILWPTNSDREVNK